MTKPTIILGIESSCDDTSAAILSDNKILANVIANQDVHKHYGGVVPELASRAHQQNIVPVIERSLNIANINKKDINAIAFTRGPGLLGSLLVGVSFAKSLALGLKIPLIEVNHMHAHILAHFVKHEENQVFPEFPFLCLTVSGGHTQIVLVKDYFDMEIVGQTIDDAAGEAFDKAAKILGLPYPGGPLVDKHAKDGNKSAFKLGIPNIPNYDYSFSGLKTSFLYLIRDNLKVNPNFIEENTNDLCATIQNAIITTLMNKLILVAKDYNIKHVAIAGGVSANSGLRQAIIDEGAKRNWVVHIPKFEFCTDNAAMIAIAGYYKFLKNEFAPQTIAPFTRGF